MLHTMHAERGGDARLAEAFAHFSLACGLLGHASAGFVNDLGKSTAIDADWLVRLWLDRQSELTAVERFSRHHESESQSTAHRYRELVPLTAPTASQQYAFEVDLDACTGCKSCVAACHSLNGLDDDETWRDVGRLVSGGGELPVLQHVTTACHHCAEPACLEGCPVNAYEKDPATGIVRHLDDQCIGCRYCMLTCPYDVPKYNERLGIVRKCDLCRDRLAGGEAPACAQACPTSAIRVVAVDRAGSARAAREGIFLAGAPDPRQTLPTTVYLRRAALPANVVPADDHEARPEHSHPPLVAMLVLTQLSVGALAVGRVLDLVAPAAFDSVRPVHVAISVGAGLLALAASILHLGRPLQAWRAMLGLRTSWLSREVLAFGIFALAAVADAALEIGWPGHPLADGLGWAAVTSGLAGVVCSVFLYDRTRRPFWRWTRTAWKFLLSGAALGIATTLLASGALGLPPPEGRGLLGALALAVAVKLVLEASVFRHLRDAAASPMHRTATLLSGDLYQRTATRFALGWIGGVAVPLFLYLLGVERLGPVALLVTATLMLALTLAGEMLERDLFFRAVSVPRLSSGAGSV